MKFVALALALAAASTSATFLRGVSTLPVVPSLNATRYLGRWIQYAGSPTVIDTFEANGTCICAQYGLNPNGTVSVFNQQRQGSPQGPLKVIYGWAGAEDPSQPAALTVHLQGVPFGAPYYIFGLGPETYGANFGYQYALVSDPFLLSLFVLVRDVEGFEANYKTDVYNRLEQLGFTEFYNKPVQTYQTNCSYVPGPGDF